MTNMTFYDICYYDVHDCFDVFSTPQEGVKKLNEKKQL